MDGKWGGGASYGWMAALYSAIVSSCCSGPHQHLNTRQAMIHETQASVSTISHTPFTAAATASSQDGQHSPWQGQWMLHCIPQRSGPGVWL